MSSDVCTSGTLRNIITLWGPRDSILHEYAARQWSGLIRDFYLTRWEMFVGRLEMSLAEDKPFDEAKFEQDVRGWEEHWTHATETFPSAPQGDPVATAQRLWQQYGNEYRRMYEPDAPSLTTGRPANCSSSLPPHPARLAVDGRARSTDQYWATDVHRDKNPWWQVDLQELTTVGRIVVVCYYGDPRYYGFTVETSLDGNSWVMVADRRDNKEPSTRLGYTCRFPPCATRYIRITQPFNSANTGRHLVEVSAFRE